MGTNKMGCGSSNDEFSASQEPVIEHEKPVVLADVHQELLMGIQEDPNKWFDAVAKDAKTEGKIPKEQLVNVMLALVCNKESPVRALFTVRGLSDIADPFEMLSRNREMADKKLGEKSAPAIQRAAVPILNKIFDVLDKDGSGSFEKKEYDEFIKMIMDEKNIPK